MDVQWYTQNEWGVVDGPLTSQMLRTRAESGVIKPDSAVRRGIDGEWGPARRIKGLFPSLSPEPPALPSSPPALAAQPSPPQVVAGSRLVPCQDCQNPVSINAASCPQCGCPLNSPASSSRYPALRAIARLHKGLAVAIALICLIGLLGLIDQPSSPEKTTVIVEVVLFMLHFRRS
jgi:hypothetical protein